MNPVGLVPNVLSEVQMIGGDIPIAFHSIFGKQRDLANSQRPFTRSPRMSGLRIGCCPSSNGSALPKLLNGARAR